MSGESLVFISASLLLILVACNRPGRMDTKLINTPEQTSVQAIDTAAVSVEAYDKRQSVFNSRIAIIHQDWLGNYWIVTHSEGLFRFDGKTFQPFGEEYELRGVRAIHEGPGGDIWFGLERAVAVFDGRAVRIVPPEPESQLITESFDYNEEDYKAGWHDESSHMWFCAYNRNGVYRFDGTSLTHLTLPVPAGYPQFDGNGYNPDHGYDIYAVYGIYKDRDLNLWFGTQGAGLFRYDGRSLTCINENEEKGVARAIIKDRSGTIWFGNNANGVYRYDGNQLINFSEQTETFEDGFEGALSIAEDSTGNIWFGTFDAGLWKYEPPEERSIVAPFTSTDSSLTQYTTEHGLDSDYVSAVFVDSDGALWIGTASGGVFNFDGKAFFPVARGAK